MPILTRPLDGEAEACTVLRRLADRARGAGVPPPAALLGDWFAGSAVLAPSVAAAPVAPAHAFQLRMAPARGSSGGAVGGGWFGYLGYPDVADRATTPQAARVPRLPRAAGGWADHVLRRDSAGQWWFEALPGWDSDDSRIDELAALVADQVQPPHRGWRIGEPAHPDAADYRDAVRAAQEHIAAGEIYQVNVCTAFRARFAGDPLEIFAAGAQQLAPARAAFVAGPWGAVGSLSPELFLARHGHSVSTSPIKGTLPRRGPADAGNAARLRRSSKDVAENVMIVDMARNDLGRVCVPGSVTVPALLQVAPHPGVWHLVSTVTGELALDVDDRALLAATFPPASVTGTPKARAEELIPSLEPAPRQAYCGAVGLASPVAGTELAVAIRTFEFGPHTAAEDDEHTPAAVRFGVGGGITADSDPRAEWDECETKAAPLLALLSSGR